MTISEKGINLIKEFEGCKLKAYQDQVGIWTIGYGETSDVSQGMQITQDEAESMLATRVDFLSEQISELLLEDANQNQFDALCDFAYNLGIAALRRSTLLTLFNQGNIEGASNEFPKWCMAGGKSNPGLLRRREAEQALFLS